MPEPITREIVVDAPIERAFVVFTERLGAWWPAAFTFSGDGYDTALMDPHEGGRWFERDRDGNELAWGEVRSWDPPRRVVLSWRVSAEREQEPPERASEVEVGFTEVGSGTRVVVLHRDFERHGSGAEAMRSGMASDQGWRRLLYAYRQAFS